MDKEQLLDRIREVLAKAEDFLREHGFVLRDLIDAVKANSAEPETVPAVNVENMVMANDMDAQSLAAQISAMTRRRQRGYGY